MLSSDSDDDLTDPRAGLRKPSILPECNESITLSSIRSNKSINLKSKLSLSMMKKRAGTYFPKNNDNSYNSSTLHQNRTSSVNFNRDVTSSDSSSKKKSKRLRTDHLDLDSSQSSDDSSIHPSQNVNRKIVRRSDCIKPIQHSSIVVSTIQEVVPSSSTLMQSPSIKCRLGTRCPKQSPAHAHAYIHVESSPSIQSECSTVISLGIPEPTPVCELGDKAEIAPVAGPTDEPKLSEVPSLPLSNFSMNSSTKENFIQHWVDSCAIVPEVMHDSSDSDTQPLPITTFDPLILTDLVTDNPQPTESRKTLPDHHEPSTPGIRGNQSSRGMVTPRKTIPIDNKPSTSSGKQSAITSYFTPCNITPIKCPTVVNITQMQSNYRAAIDELNVTLTNSNNLKPDVHEIDTDEEVGATPFEENAPSNLKSDAKEKWAYIMSRMNMRGTANNLQREMKKVENQKSHKKSTDRVFPKQSSIEAEASTESRKCPFYKKIPDTGFVVDAFSYGKVPGVSSYFLSHFHYDHYRGLGKWLDKPLYCSQVTANLINLKIKLNPGIIRVLPLNESRVIDNVEVILIDANHCPGSVMFLFRFPTGKNVLHVGDFRAHPSMERLHELKQYPIDDLYLDTTYCDEHYELPAQEEVLSYIRRIVRRYASKHQKLLVVCGAYTIGKEKVFVAAAEELKCKVWAPTEKRRILNCLDDRTISGRLVVNPLEANVHVVNMGDIKPGNLKRYLDSLNGTFTHILALNPTGWEYDGNMAKKGLDAISPKSYYNSIFIHGVPYSEHSGFSEMKRFVRCFCPKKIIPTVNVGSVAQRQKMEAIFIEWLRR